MIRLARQIFEVSCHLRPAKLFGYTPNYLLSGQKDIKKVPGTGTDLQPALNKDQLLQKKYQLLEQFIRKTYAEAQKRRQEEAQKKEQEETQKKEQEEAQKKKQEEAQKKKQKAQQNWKIAGGIATIVAIATGLRQLYHSEQSRKIQQEESIPNKLKRVLIKYGDEQEKAFKDLQYYEPNNSTEKQLQELFSLKYDQIHFITGLPGNGKTSSIHYLLKKMWGNKEKVYYINLRQQNSTGDMDFKLSQQAVNDLTLLINAVTGQYFKDPTKRVVLIIDDINVLQTLFRVSSITGEKIFNLQFLLTRTSAENLNVFAISSSSSYSQRMRQKSHIQKRSDFFVIQQKKRDEIRKAMRRIFKHSCRIGVQGFPKSFDYMMLEGFSLRRVFKKLQIIKDKTDEQMLQSLKTDVIEQQQNLQISIQKVLGQHKLKSEGKYDFSLIKSLIVQDPYQFQINRMKCTQIYKKLNNQRGNEKYGLPEIINAMQKLDEMNLLIYCQPRSAWINNLFIKLVKQAQSAQVNGN